MRPSAAQPATFPETTSVELPVRLARQQRAQFLAGALQDVPAAAALVLAGVAGARAPRGGGDLALALVELAVAGWVLLLTARGAAELFGRRDTGPTHVGHSAPAPRSHAPRRVRWEGVAAGLLALVEVWHHWHVTGHVRRPTLLVAMTTLAMALGGAAVIERRAASRRPRLVVSRDGVLYRGSRRRRFEARWDAVARVERTGGALRVVLHDGASWVLAARDHLDGEALVAGAVAALRAHAPARVAAALDPTGADPPERMTSAAAASAEVATDARA